MSEKWVWFRPFLQLLRYIFTHFSLMKWVRSHFLYTILMLSFCSFQWSHVQWASSHRSLLFYSWELAHWKWHPWKEQKESIKMVYKKFVLAHFISEKHTKTLLNISRLFVFWILNDIGGRYRKKSFRKPQLFFWDLSIDII